MNIPAKGKLNNLLAAKFAARAANIYPNGGVKRDDAAMEFFLGAAAAFDILGCDKDRDAVLLAATFGIAIKGYKAVDKLVKDGFLGGKGL